MRPVARAATLLTLVLAAARALAATGCDTSDCDPTTNCVPVVPVAVDAGADAVPTDARAETATD